MNNNTHHEQDIILLWLPRHFIMPMRRTRRMSFEFECLEKINFKFEADLGYQGDQVGSFEGKKIVDENLRQVYL
jgi:hypothetical protein